MHALDTCSIGFTFVKTCEVFLCFVAIVRARSIMLTSLFFCFMSLASVTGFYTKDEPFSSAEKTPLKLEN